MMNLTDAFIKFQTIFNQDDEGDINQTVDKSIKEILLKGNNAGKSAMFLFKK